MRIFAIADLNRSDMVLGYVPVIERSKVRVAMVAFEYCVCVIVLHCNCPVLACATSSQTGEIKFLQCGCVFYRVCGGAGMASDQLVTTTRVVHERKVRREIANSNERKRMQSINAGFQSLRLLLPRTGAVDRLSKVGSALFCRFI